VGLTNGAFLNWKVQDFLPFVTLQGFAKDVTVVDIGVLSVFLT
jgi:hypothetical protein